MSWNIPSRAEASSRLGVRTVATGISADFIASTASSPLNEEPLVETSTGSTTTGSGFEPFSLCSEIAYMQCKHFRRYPSAVQCLDCYYTRKNHTLT